MASKKANASRILPSYKARVIRVCGPYRQYVELLHDKPGLLRHVHFYSAQVGGMGSAKITMHGESLLPAEELQALCDAAVSSELLRWDHSTCIDLPRSTCSSGVQCT